MPRKSPPRKQPGVKTGPRVFNGAVLDIRSGATHLGWTDKTLRARIARGEIPARKLGGRIVLIRSELEEWLESLPRVAEVNHD